MTIISCQQLSPRIADLAANREMSVQSVGRAVAAGADVVVLPELVTSGYVFASRAEAASVAITPAHPLFADWAAAAARGPAIVIGGFCELGDDGLLYNSAALVDGTGVRGVYRKTHLWDTEKRIFEPGGELPPVFGTAYGRIGILICYDLEFPEMTRTLALRGADLVAVPTNWPLMPRPAGEHPPEVIIAMAAARTNRMFIACCDRGGTERGQQWTSGTAIIDESGWVISAAASAVPAAGGAASGGTGPGPGGEAATAEVNLAAARSKALTELSDALGDRRPELYSDVIALPGASISSEPVQEPRGL